MGVRPLLCVVALVAALGPAAAAQAAPAPGDPLYASEQEALHPGMLDAPAAWALGGYGDGSTVALLDTGADLTHPDLQGSLWTNPGEVAANGVDDDGDGWVDDVHGVDLVNRDGDPTDDEGHGTHVAGIVAAQRNTIGTVGLAPGAKLMVVKVLDGDRSGSTGTVADGIRYAIAHGADVINVSVNGDTASASLVSAANAAAAAGVPVVASAGNDGRDLDLTPSFPAALPGDQVLGVAATAPSGVLAVFSNFGLSEVDLAAPGEDIASTKRGGGYEDRSGTSMAAPFVSATLALLHGARPDLRGDALVDALRRGLARPAGLDGLLQGGALDPVAALRGVVDPARVAAADAAAAAPLGLTARVARRGGLLPRKARAARVRRTLVTWTLTGDASRVARWRVSGARGTTLLTRGAAARGAWLATRARQVRVSAVAADGTLLATAAVRLR